jgi:hypothetical protein
VQNTLFQSPVLLVTERSSAVLCVLPAPYWPLASAASNQPAPNSAAKSSTFPSHYQPRGKLPWTPPTPRRATDRRTMLINGKYVRLCLVTFLCSSPLSFTLSGALRPNTLYWRQNVRFGLSYSAVLFKVQPPHHFAHCSRYFWTQFRTVTTRHELQFFRTKPNEHFPAKHFTDTESSLLFYYSIACCVKSQLNPVHIHSRFFFLIQFNTTPRELNDRVSMEQTGNRGTGRN